MAGTATPDPAAPTMTWEQHHEAGRRRFAEGDAAGAEEAFRAAIAEAERTGGDPLQRASSLSSLGQLKYQQKDYQGAEECFRQSLELREAALGADHPTVISGINNLAALFVARGALDEAEPLLQRAMAVTVKRVEATQAELAVNLNNLVRLYVKRGDYSRAEPLVVRLLALKRPLGPEHPDVAAVLVTLAKLRQSMGQSDAAERLWRRVLAVRQRTLAPNDTLLASTLDGLADSCAAQGKTEEELSLRERSLAVRAVSLGADNPSLEAHRARIAALRQAAGRGGASAAPGAANGGVPTLTGAASRLGGVSGLTGVIPNVIPEAVAVTRAMEEQAAVAATPPRAEPATGGRTAVRVSGSSAAISARAPAGSLTPTRPVDKQEAPSAPPPALPETAPDGATHAVSTSEQPAVEQKPRISAPLPSVTDGVKWVEPSTLVPSPPRARRSVEMARPKSGPGAHGRPSASAANRAVPLVAALVLACAAAAAWYGRHHWLGNTTPSATHPAGSSHRQPQPDTAGLAPGEPAPTSSAIDQGSGGSGTAGASLTSGPAPSESTAPGTEAAAPEVPPVAAASARMSTLPERPISRAPAVVHHRVAARDGDSVAAVPAINVDAATRAIDSSAKARHSPATTP